MQKTQQHEATLTELITKMNNMEAFLVSQRQKSQRLESELSAVQDRIGGAERRTQLLEAENLKIKGELQSWNEYYEQEEVPSAVLVSQSPLTIALSVASVSVATSFPLQPFTEPLQMDVFDYRK